MLTSGGFDRLLYSALILLGFGAYGSLMDKNLFLKCWVLMLGILIIMVGMTVPVWMADEASLFDKCILLIPLWVVGGLLLISIVFGNMLKVNYLMISKPNYLFQRNHISGSDVKVRNWPQIVAVCWAILSVYPLINLLRSSVPGFQIRVLMSVLIIALLYKIIKYLETHDPIETLR